jgi:hypothetical protein
MIPVVHLGSGKYFGELAISINKENPNKVITRAATVECLTNCYFGTLCKSDY